MRQKINNKSALLPLILSGQALIINQSAIFVGSEARRMPGSLSASSTYNLKVTRVKYASSPPLGRLNIIFDLIWE